MQTYVKKRVTFATARGSETLPPSDWRRFARSPHHQRTGFIPLGYTGYKPSLPHHEDEPRRPCRSYGRKASFFDGFGKSGFLYIQKI